MSDSVLCDVVQSQYPDVLEAIKSLSQLKDASKLELTATLKLKRNVVHDHYKKEIDSLYN